MPQAHSSVTVGVIVRPPPSQQSVTRTSSTLTKLAAGSSSVPSTSVEIGSVAMNENDSRVHSMVGEPDTILNAWAWPATVATRDARPLRP